MAGGIEHLRAKRGEERVTFGDVADHLADFVSRQPKAAEVVDRLADFLARVEDVSHDHDVSGTGSSTTRASPA